MLLYFWFQHSSSNLLSIPSNQDLPPSGKTQQPSSIWNYSYFKKPGFALTIINVIGESLYESDKLLESLKSHVWKLTGWTRFDRFKVEIFSNFHDIITVVVVHGWHVSARHRWLIYSGRVECQRRNTKGHLNTCIQSDLPIRKPKNSVKLSAYRAGLLYPMRTKVTIAYKH